MYNKFITHTFSMGYGSENRPILLIYTLPSVHAQSFDVIRKWLSIVDIRGRVAQSIVCSIMRFIVIK